MTQLSSVTAATKILDLRDGQSFPVVLYTGLGRNGVRHFRMADGANRPINLSDLELRLVVKTDLDAAITELDPSFPLSCVIECALEGTFLADFSGVDFLTPQARVYLVLYDASGASPLVLAQVKTVIRKAGI